MGSGRIPESREAGAAQPASWPVCAARGLGKKARPGCRERSRTAVSGTETETETRVPCRGVARPARCAGGRAVGGAGRGSRR
jgi:hypothetical protein